MKKKSNLSEVPQNTAYIVHCHQWPADIAIAVAASVYLASNAASLSGVTSCFNKTYCILLLHFVTFSSNP